MNFIDKASVFVQAGDGGDGRVSFRHEKYVDHGGPDGGDGGDGGDVIFVSSNNQNTLANFRFQKTLAAKPGGAGDKRKKHGKSGEDLVVPLPVGTVIADEAGAVLADLVVEGQQAVIAKGGKGGFGNAHFISSTRQAPRVAEKGEKGQALSVSLELKMIADVGLVGLPNAGKSTLLSVVSNAEPEIANYPFTTLTPNLGVVDIDRKNSLLFADIPGLIEGAAQGKGLGDEFLRHIERTAVLIHLIDAYQNDIVQTYKTVQLELKNYGRLDLSKKPQIVAINKIDGLSEDIVEDLKSQLKKSAPRGAKIVCISAVAKTGLPELLRETLRMVEAARAKQQKPKKESEEIPVLRLPDQKVAWKVEKTKKGFVVTGNKIERFAMRTDFENEEGLRRLRDIMRKMGIIHELKRQGASPGDNVSISTIGSVEY